MGVLNLIEYAIQRNKTPQILKLWSRKCIFRSKYLEISTKYTIFAPTFQAEVAQLVEQRIRNAWVTGSSPVFGS